MTKPEQRMIAFVVMPFGDESDNRYQHVIKPACQDAGLDCRRVDELIFHGDVFQEIYSQIAKADIIIADLSQGNTNVWYELGYAHALGKQTILIAAASERLPFDLGRSRVITGVPDSTHMKEELTDALRSSLDVVGAKRLEDRADFGVQTERVAIVFGDLVGSTSIISSLGELDFSEFIRHYMARVASLAKEHGGRHIKSMGDGFLAIFDAVGDALSFASDISQLRLESKRPGASPVLTRIGIHLGPVGIRRSQYGEDLMGHGVILAARLADVAGAGEILLSEDAARSLPSHHFQQLTSKGEMSLKGIEISSRVFALRPVVGGQAHE